MQYSLNKDLQHLKWQPAKITDIISRLPGFDGQATDAVSAYTQVKMEDAHKWLKIPKSECPDIWIRLPRQVAKIMVQYGRSSRSSCKESVRSSFGRTIMGKAIWENLFETWLGENSKLGMSLCTSWKRIILICVCGWHKIGWKETNSWSDVESTQQRSRFGRTNIFPWSCILGMHSKTMPNKQRYCGQLQNHVRIANFRGGSREIAFPQNLRISSWSFDIAGHAKKCVERYCELANKTTQQLCKVSTPYIDDHHFKEEAMKSFRELSHVCSHIVLKRLYLARIGRLDILWSVNKLARSITKWTKASDKRFHTFNIFLITNNIVMWGNTAKQCRLGLFQDSDFAGDLEDSKSTSGGTVCIFGSHTFVPKSWMCKKQTAVSHSSTESEIISLDTGLRLDGLLALELWDLIVSVLGNVFRVSDRSGQPDDDVHKRHKLDKKVDVMNDIDSVPSNVQSAQQEALLCVFEDSEAVIKMITKGRSPTMRHVSRTHRVVLDWLFDRINLDSKIQIKYIDTRNQLADILTKGNFTRDEWNHLLNLFHISHFSSTARTVAMAKRAQQESGEERTAKIKAYDEFNIENAFDCVVFNFIKPGEDLVWLTIDRRNLIDSHQQDIQNRIMIFLGLLKSGKVRLRRTIDQGNLMKCLGMRCNKFASSWRTSSRRKCAIRKVRREFMMDRGNLIVIITKKRQIPKFSSWTVTQQNLWIKQEIKCETDTKPCRTLQGRTFNNSGNGYGSDECGDIHGKEFRGYSKFHHEFQRSHLEENVRHHIQKLVSEQDEIYNVDKIQWAKNSGKQLSLIGDETVINLQRTKVYVFSDSVLCSRRILQHPASNEAWKKRIEWIITEKSYRDFDGINGEPTEFEWNILSCQDSQRCRSAVKSMIYWATWEKHQKLSQEEFSLCQCSTTSLVTEKAMKKNVWHMSESSPYLQRDLELDSGNFLVQVPERSGILRKRKVHKELGIMSLTKHWNSQKADILFSVQRLHCPGVNSREKDTENCRFTIVPTRQRLRLFFA